jgi:hypothetical protein
MPHRVAPAEAGAWVRVPALVLIRPGTGLYPSQLPVASRYDPLADASVQGMTLVCDGGGPIGSSWQPRLPDLCCASPALDMASEDKSGTALAWVFLPS